MSSNNEFVMTTNSQLSNEMEELTDVYVCDRDS